MCGNTCGNPAAKGNGAAGGCGLAQGKGTGEHAVSWADRIGNPSMSACDAITALHALWACLCSDCFLLLTLKKPKSGVYKSACGKERERGTH